MGWEGVLQLSVAVADLMLGFLRLGSITNTFILSFLSEKSIRESEWS